MQTPRLEMTHVMPLVLMELSEVVIVLCPSHLSFESMAFGYSLPSHAMRVQLERGGTLLEHGIEMIMLAFQRPGLPQLAVPGLQRTLMCLSTKKITERRLFAFKCRYNVLPVLVTKLPTSAGLKLRIFLGCAPARLPTLGLMCMHMPQLSKTKSWLVSHDLGPLDLSSSKGDYV
jgi:hypothetical protein